MKDSFYAARVAFSCKKSGVFFRFELIYGRHSCHCVDVNSSLYNWLTFMIKYIPRRQKISSCGTFHEISYSRMTKEANEIILWDRLCKEKQTIISRMLMTWVANFFQYDLLRLNKDVEFYKSSEFFVGFIILQNDFRQLDEQYDLCFEWFCDNAATCVTLGASNRLPSFDSCCSGQ